MPFDDGALPASVARIARRHGLGFAVPRRYDSGSLPVYALGDAHVLKLYPSEDAAHAAVEARVLDVVDGSLPLRTPSLVAVGDFDQGSYLLMTQLPGHRLVEVWPELQADDRDRLADALGEALAALHALDSSALADLPPPHWPSFVPAQRASATARQRARGLAEPWLEQIDTFLDHWGAPLGDERVLLHTEVMREHLLAEHDGRGWRLGALIDFEPAMLGERDYEFASVGLFVSCGDGRLLRRLLRAYGWREALLDEALSCRLMAQALLHRYSHLRWYLERLPCPGARTLEQLACHWFALDADA